MKKWLLFQLLVMTFSLTNAQPSEYAQLIAEGYKLYKEKKFPQALEKYKAAIKIDSTYADDLYNGACVAALANKPQTAFELLRKAIENGYVNKAHMQEDPDLQQLRCLPEWTEQVELIKSIQKTAITEETILEKIEKYILLNMPDSLIILSSDSFKIKIPDAELKSKVNTISSLTSTHQVKSFQNFDNTFSSSSLSYNNGRVSETREQTYTYLPLFFGKATNQLFINPVGFSVKIEISKDKNKWFLNYLEVDSNYLNKDFDLGAYSANALGGTDTCFVQYKVIAPSKNIVGVTSLVSDKKSFSKCFKNIQYLSIAEFVKPAVDKKNIIAVSFFSKEMPGNSFFNSHNYKLLEIIFVDDNTNLCLVSNGSKYALYRMADLQYIRDFIYKEAQRLN